MCRVRRRIDDSPVPEWRLKSHEDAPRIAKSPAAPEHGRRSGRRRAPPADGNPNVLRRLDDRRLVLNAANVARVVHSTTCEIDGDDSLVVGRPDSRPFIWTRHGNLARLGMLRCRPGCASVYWVSTTTPNNDDGQDQQSSQHHTPVADDHSRRLPDTDRVGNPSPGVRRQTRFRRR